MERRLRGTDCDLMIRQISPAPCDGRLPSAEFAPWSPLIRCFAPPRYRGRLSTPPTHSTRFDILWIAWILEHWLEM